MLHFLIGMAVIMLMTLYLPRLAALAIAAIWAVGACVCVWMLGPLLGLPTYRSMGDAPWYFGSIFLFFLVFGFFGIFGILRNSGRIE